MIHLLCEQWPEGEIFNRAVDEDSPVMTPSHLTRPSKRNARHELGIKLAQAFPDAEQLITMPLWDPLYDRVTTVVVGIAHTWDRVFTRSQDLFPMASFCASVMHHAHRMQARHMKQRKSDFLGSVSHEMRSPLHGTLANLELVLETHCTEEQRSMLRTALLSGKQLLTSIDKVLAYAQISADPETFEMPITPAASDEIAGVSPSMAEPPFDVAGTSATTLRDTMEEAVSDAVGRSDRTKDFLEDTATPVQPVNASTSDMKSFAAPLHHGRTTSGTISGIKDKRESVIVILDACNIPVPSTLNVEVLKLLVEELLTNALKHTISGCIRISLLSDTSADAHAAGMLLRVEDCGTGISDEFVKHRLYVPFSQDDHFESGTGLGLSLLKQRIQSLGGTVAIESAVGVGTVVSIHLPTTVTNASPQSVQPSLPLQTSDAVAQLFIPPEPQPASAQKAHEMLHESLTQTLATYCDVQVVAWDPTNRPALVIVAEKDLQALEDEDLLHRNLPLLVLRSSKGASHEYCDSTASIASPLLPSQIARSVNALLGMPQSNTENALQASEPSVPSEEVSFGAQRTDNDYTAHSVVANTEHMESLAEPHMSGEQREQLRTPMEPGLPSVLLVDDNLVNLKVVERYVQQCNIHNPTAVSGGQEAIDAFEQALNGGQGQAFDIILMDLSMPVVSGFDATARIRELERQARGCDEQSVHQRTTTIIALTGLVSAKDRKAAFEAGVDGYITKPAKVQSIKDVIQSWKDAHD
ncbi:uncharacterized protein LTR77_010773 [Saxophila tyrrhenica]|uniref:Histidine kinase n=1 Tax=Saxophila tyrrhenica TaxID=1690608 RepID=A0AAV9NUX4_9PEZI|nr:hypothetical protein LTR77_010773 [Saxophila tyrrhenica]